jgi:hypothetical protein
MWMWGWHFLCFSALKEIPAWIAERGFAVLIVVMFRMPPSIPPTSKLTTFEIWSEARNNLTVEYQV